MVAYLHAQVVSQLVCFDQSDGLIPDDLGGEWRTRHRVNASHLSSHGDKIQKIARGDPRASIAQTFLESLQIYENAHSGWIIRRTILAPTCS